MIARVLGIREDRVNALRYAGILHDVGKLGVPTKILQKTSGLSDDEFAMIQTHPLRGTEMLQDIEFLDEAFKGILHHHERVDGLGYPAGLRGEEIPEFARVIAVADAFDSMTSTRSYRGARTPEDAVGEIERCRGTQFDPIMVDALVQALHREPWVSTTLEPPEDERRPAARPRPRRPDRRRRGRPGARPMTSTVLVPRRVEELRGTAVVVGVTGPARRLGRRPDRDHRDGPALHRDRLRASSSPSARSCASRCRATARRLRSGAAGALAYALLTTFGGVATTQDVWQVISLTALASFLGALPHVTAGRSPRLDEIARRILAAAFAAALFRPLYDGGLGPLAQQERWVQAVVMVAIVLATGVFDAAVSALVRADRNRSPYRSTLRDELRALLGLGLRHRRDGRPHRAGRAGHGLWAIPVFCVPLLLTQFSFRRYAAIRATYLQTIRSLSRVTEVGGYTESGHARRVSEISVAVGRELGMSEDELLDLEYAALMHDLGQLSLSEPIPGGATVMVDPGEQRRIAELGRRRDPRDRRARPRRRDHRASGRPLPPSP